MARSLCPDLSTPVAFRFPRMALARQYFESCPAEKLVLITDIEIPLQLIRLRLGAAGHYYSHDLSHHRACSAGFVSAHGFEPQLHITRDMSAKWPPKMRHLRISSDKSNFGLSFQVAELIWLKVVTLSENFSILDAVTVFFNKGERSVYSQAIRYVKFIALLVRGNVSEKMVSCKTTTKSLTFHIALSNVGVEEMVSAPLTDVGALRRTLEASDEGTHFPNLVGCSARLLI
jgi:hypothetical protein